MHNKYSSNIYILNYVKIIALYNKLDHSIRKQLKF